MTEQDHKIKEMIESGMYQVDICEKLGISMWALQRSPALQVARRPMPKNKAVYMSSLGVRGGAIGSEIKTLADFEIDALMTLVHKRKAESVAAALMDFWLEHGDI